MMFISIVGVDLNSIFLDYKFQEFMILFLNSHGLLRTDLILKNPDSPFMNS